MKRPPRPLYEYRALEAAEQMRSEAGAFEPLLHRRLADLNNLAGDMSRARGAATGAVQQSLAGFGLTPFERAMRRSGALARIALQGEGQIEQQSLRDRIGMVRFGQGIRAGSNRGLLGLAEGQAEVNAAKMRARQTEQAAYANLFGTVAGAAAARWGTK